MMAIHRFFFGSRTRCAQLYPLARSKLSIVREVMRRSGQTSASQRFDLTTGDIIFLYINGTEEYIYIHTGGWTYASIGWGDNENYIRVANTLSDFPRRVATEAGAFSRDHLVQAEGAVIYPLTPENTGDVRTGRMTRKGVPQEGFTLATGGSSFLVGTPRSMYATLYEEPIFAFGAKAWGTYYWTDVTGTPKFLRTLDGGETVEKYELPVLQSLNGDPFDYSVAGPTWYVGPVNKDLLLSVIAVGDPSGYRMTVLRSVDKGATWTELVDLVRMDYTGDAVAFEVLTPWDGFSLDLGGTVSEAHIEDWSNIFCRTLTFYTMADRILMFAFLVINRTSEGEQSGYWRAYISTDNGATWVAQGIISVAVQDGELRTILTDPGYFRQPVVLPDNRILSVQAGGSVSIANQDATQFNHIASLPHTNVAELGVPSPVLVKGQFKVTVTAFTGTAIIVYMNTDDTYTSWEIVGTVEEMDSLPQGGLPVLYPFTRVLGLNDPINPAFPDAFAEVS